MKTMSNPGGWAKDNWFEPIMHASYCKCAKCYHREQFFKLEDNELTKLCKEIGIWADDTFGSVRTVDTVLKHLGREVNELKSEPDDLMEYADCAILLFDAARLAGYSPDQVVDAMRKKLEINKTRTWGEPDSEGVIEHVEPLCDCHGSRDCPASRPPDDE